MNIAHVALWTRSLNAQVQFWETVFNGRSNARYVSKNRPGFESHFITLDEGPTIELMTIPDLPDAPAPFAEPRVPVTGGWIALFATIYFIR